MHILSKTSEKCLFKSATEIPKSKIINNNPSQDIEETDEIDLSLDCKLCQKKFSCKAKLKQHQEKEKNPCDVCLKLFCTKKELDSHKKIKHKQKKFECDSCSKDFDTKYHLNRHYKSRNLQTCEHCGLVLCNQVDMIRHVSNSHKVWIKIEIENLSVVIDLGKLCHMLNIPFVLCAYAS